MKKRLLFGLILLWMMLIVALLSSALTLRLIGRTGKLTLVTEDQYEIISRYERLDRIRATLRDDYYQELDDDKLVLGAIRGLMQAVGDPYTYYYTAEEMMASKETHLGLIHGIGMVIRKEAEDSFVVVKVYEGGGAAQAGIEVGDVLVAVEDEIVGGEGLSFEEVPDRVKGEDGTYVRLQLRRNGESYETEAIRGEVEASNINSCMLDDDIGYINIERFMGNAAEQFPLTIDRLEQEGAVGIIVDLRGDPGGLLDQVVPILDSILPEGIVSYMTDVQGNYQEERSSAQYNDIPMVVIVNGDSASASELFSAAVQDYKRAKIVGTTTYGKGIMQTVITFEPEGDGMQYTTASYYSPNGHSINETGVEPDVYVEMEEGTYFNVYQPDPESDLQLRTAIDTLRAEIAG